MIRFLFILIVAFVTAGFIIDRILEWLNSTRWSSTLPDKLADYYSAEKYKRSQQYHHANNRLNRVSSLISFLLLLGMLFFNGFAFIDNMVVRWSDNAVIQSLMFFGVLALGSGMINLPFLLYSTFVIEERFGFNKSSLKTFVFDQIKSIVLMAVLGGGILALIIVFWQSAGLWFWPIAWGIMTVFSLFFAMFYSTIIVPLFNKQIPLAEGQLRDDIEDFAHNAGFKLDNIYVIDGSKRSSKANAYFAGIGPKKRIVLFDTLIKEHSSEELVAILAHEIGHYKLKHIRYSLLLGILQTGVFLGIFSIFVRNPMLSLALGAHQMSFHMGAVAFAILYTPLSLLSGLLMNGLSRKNEFEADRFAATYANGKALQKALIRLSVHQLSNLNPHPAYVFVHYSHPPLLKRLEALDTK